MIFLSDDITRCPSCGAEADPDDESCARCGLPLVPGQPAAAEPRAHVTAEDIGARYDIGDVDDSPRNVRTRARNRQQASRRSPLPAVLLGLVVIALIAAAAYFGFKWLTSGRELKTADGAATAYMTAVEQWDAERVYELTLPSERADKKTVVEDMNAVKEDAKGKPILKDPKVKSVKSQGADRAVVTMDYQLLDTVSGKYDAGSAELVMVRKDGRWYYQSGAL